MAGSPPPDAFEAAVRLLTARPHSALELRHKLRRRGCPGEEIDAALERVREVGYQSDAGFAESLVRARASGRGRIAVAADLASRGVDRETADAALAGITPEVELSAARQVAARMPDVDAGRLGSRLQRRGFSGEAVRQVMLERAASRDEDTLY